MKQFVKNIAMECRHVSWPKRNFVILSTIGILIISFFVAAYLGTLDGIFTSIVKNIL